MGLGGRVTSNTCGAEGQVCAGGERGEGHLVGARAVGSVRSCVWDCSKLHRTPTPLPFGCTHHLYVVHEEGCARHSQTKLKLQVVRTRAWRLQVVEPARAAAERRKVLVWMGLSPMPVFALNLQTLALLQAPHLKSFHTVSTWGWRECGGWRRCAGRGPAQQAESDRYRPI